jgi:hypothetical protein
MNIVSEKEVPDLPCPKKGVYDLPRLEQIAQELLTRPVWVVSRRIERTGRNGKVRRTQSFYDPHSGLRARRGDPSTWSTLEDAVYAWRNGIHGQRFDGIRFYVPCDLGKVSDRMTRWLAGFVWAALRRPPAPFRVEGKWPDPEQPEKES